MDFDKPVRAAYFQVTVALRIRILLPHEDKWHAIFWFRFGKDGSLYFGPPYKPTGESSYGRKIKPGKSYALGPEDMIEVTDPALIRDSHTSVHTSGAINMSGERFYRESLRNLFEQEHICSILFERPENYPVVESRPSGTSDIMLKYPVDYSRPLVGEINISPRGTEKYILVRNAPYQVNPIFQFSGFSDGIDRSVQFVLCHLNEADWPNATYLVIPSGKRVWKDRLRRFWIRLTSRWIGLRARRENGVE